jgi:hypothetical protein
VLTALCLPLRFDLSRLQADLAAIPSSDWSPHYNERDYGGEWRGAALRSASGAPGDLRSVAPQFHDTPLLDRCPYFREVLSAFPCALRAVRLLGLAPGSFIREHTDDALDYEDGLVRIHIPVQTNAGVEFYLAGERLLLDAGGAFYVNVNLPHRVNNRGEWERVHLVIDAEVDDWVRALFESSTEIPRCSAPWRGVDAFRTTVLADPALREQLRAIDDRHEFLATAVRLGREADLDFHEGDLEALLHGAARAGEPGGLPIAVSVRDGNAWVEWIDAGGRQLTEPFFDDTVRASLRNPYARFSRRESPIGPGEHTTAPSGFIFHVSRCGSTLVSQLLAAAGYRVISEASPVDRVMQEGRADWLRWIVAALGAGRPSFVKLDAWHIHQLPLVREAFPDTPWIFVYRNPAEVLISHRRSPGRHMLPGALDPRALAMAPDDITAVPRDAWPARVLEKICESALRHHDDPRGLFVDYRELPDAMWTAVARHFGLDLRDNEVARMRDASRFHAKNPAALFEPDTAGKQEEARQLIAHTELDQLYGQLTKSGASPARAVSAPPAA